MPKNRRIQKIVVTGRATLPLSVMLAAVLWVVSGLLLSDGATKEQAEGYYLWAKFDGLGLSDGLNAAICFLIYGVVGYLLVLLNNAYAIIRMRASAQTAFYLLFLAACPGVHQHLHVGCLAALLFLASLHFLFHSYQRRNPEGDLTHAFLFLGLGSLVFPQITWLAPIYWIGAWMFQSLRLKSFLASLIGWTIPYWFLFCMAYFFGEMEFLYAPFRELVHVRELAYNLRPETMATLGYLLFILLSSTAHYILSGLDDSIRTRCYLQFFILLSFCLMAYIALQPVQGALMLPVALVGVSFLAAHLFVLTDNRASNVFFIVALIGLFVLFGYNLTTLLR